MTANNKIIKNTGFLYFRSILILLITLYTSRIILEVIGIEDYGIYNVIGGIVIMFNFLNAGMVAASQRYIAYALGKQDEKSLKEIFSMSMSIHLLLSVFIFIVAEIIGVWFLNSYLNIPTNRLFAANIVYQCSIVTFLTKVINVPYNALILAHEKMQMYAYISLIEAILKLGLVYFLLILNGDLLIYYSMLTLMVSILIYITYAIYCRVTFKECRYKLSQNKKLFYEMLQFAGWSFWGNLGFSAKNQGVNIILNIFFSPVVNAARGIAYQVEAAIMSFIDNFQSAMKPQIIKRYANEEYDSMMTLIFAGAKYSFYIMMLIAIPVILHSSYILNLWLRNVPLYTTNFLQLAMIASMIESMKGPLGEFFNATGKIRNYQLLLSILMLTTLPLAYLLLYWGGKPYDVIYINILISLLALLLRLYLMNNIIKINIRKFIIDFFLRNIILFLISFTPLYYIINTNPIDDFLHFIAFIIFETLYSILVIYIFGLNKNEKMKVNNFIKRLGKVLFLRRTENKNNYITQIKKGQNCRLIECTCSSEPYLISIGNHVSATRTHFETHDGAVWIFREKQPTWDIIKPIIIKDNVYIGTGCVILPGVTIGNNVIIGAGSIVTKDIPDNSVYAGIPARFIETTEEYISKNRKSIHETKNMSFNSKKEYYISFYKDVLNGKEK